MVSGLLFDKNVFRKEVVAADRSLFVVTRTSCLNLCASLSGPPAHAISVVSASSYRATKLVSSAVGSRGFQYKNGFSGFPSGGTI